jgi:hypothetical protein
MQWVQCRLQRLESSKPMSTGKEVGTESRPRHTLND